MCSVLVDDHQTGARRTDYVTAAYTYAVALRHVWYSCVAEYVGRFLAEHFWRHGVEGASGHCGGAAFVAESFIEPFPVARGLTKCVAAPECAPGACGGADMGCVRHFCRLFEWIVVWIEIELCVGFEIGVEKRQWCVVGREIDAGHAVEASERLFYGCDKYLPDSLFVFKFDFVFGRVYVDIY